MIDNDVRAFRPTDVTGGESEAAIGKVDPRTGCIDEQGRAHFKFFAGQLIAQVDRILSAAHHADIIQRAGIGAVCFSVQYQFRGQPLGI